MYVLVNTNKKQSVLRMKFKDTESFTLNLNLSLPVSPESRIVYHTALFFKLFYIATLCWEEYNSSQNTY